MTEDATLMAADGSMDGTLMEAKVRARTERKDVMKSSVETPSLASTHVENKSAIRSQNWAGYCLVIAVSE